MPRRLPHASSAGPQPRRDCRPPGSRRAHGQTSSGTRAGIPATSPGFGNRPMNYSDVQRLEAAEWFFDIHDAEDPSAELLQEWIRWLDASEGNRRAFEAVESAYHQ